MGHRIHITGASGTGTSTLGRDLAARLESQAFDTDDFYWKPTDPPFVEKRPVSERIRLMEEVFLGRSDWILSGSLHSWGGPLLPRITHVVFLTLDSAKRLARLRRRERLRYGDRLVGVGDMATTHRAFLDWAMSYDDPNATGRSRASHEAWLDTLTVPITRLDTSAPTSKLSERVLADLNRQLGAA